VGRFGEKRTLGCVRLGRFKLDPKSVNKKSGEKNGTRTVVWWSLALVGFG